MLYGIRSHKHIMFSNLPSEYITMNNVFGGQVTER